MKYEYDIGGTIYEQRPLVLGQAKQLLAATEGVRIPRLIDPSGGISIDIVELARLMGDQLPLALAVVLTEKGKSARGKDLPALADDIEFAVTLEQTLDIISDFFVCNPLSSFLEKLAGATGRLNAVLPPTGLQGSVSPSAPGTSQSETGSSGA
jgi:hypothetical protein